MEVEEEQQPLAALNEKWRHLVLSARETEAPRRALRDSLVQLQRTLDALRQVVTDESRFAGSDPRQSVPLQHTLRALAAAVDEHAAGADEAASAYDELAQVRERNVEQFRYWAIDTLISRRLPEEMNARTPLPPLPRVDLANPALGRAANNVGDDAPMHESLAGISLFG